MIKILIDAHCFDYGTSEGINTYIKGIYSELIKIAPDLEFYFAAKNIDKLKKIFGIHNHVKYIKLEESTKYKRLIFEFPRIIKDYGIDFAHFQYTAPPIKKCKYIVTLHDILFKDFPQLFPLSYRLSKDFLFKLSAKKADLLLTVSEYSKNRISHFYNISSQKIITTPNAVSEDFFNINEKEAKEFVNKIGLKKYILYVSRIEQRKNQLNLIKAFVELKLYQNGYSLVLVGRPTIPIPGMEEYISNLSEEIKSYIKIFGDVAYEDLKYFYKASSYFIYPSLAEGFGIPPLEAGAACIPVLCNNLTAMSDFTFFGKNHTDISNLSELKSAIKNFLNAPINTDALRIISNNIQTLYNWERSAMILYKALKNYK